jgi:hypothetical protein
MGFYETAVAAHSAGMKIATLIAQQNSTNLPYAAT